MSINKITLFNSVCILILLIILYIHNSTTILRRMYAEYFSDTNNLRVYFHSFWPDFPPLTRQFFCEILSHIYNAPVIEGDYNNSNILMESVFGGSVLKDKPWKHTYLYSGESYLRDNHADYTCILSGESDTFSPNNVAVPLYSILLHALNSTNDTRLNTDVAPHMPKKDVVVIISNGGAGVRNTFVDELDKHFQVTYAGRYKNNTGGPLAAAYGTQEFADYVSQFKFVITMENSEQDTYITEKIFHGIHSHTIPVYWGAPRVTEYINPARFIHMKSIDDILPTIEKMKALASDERAWQAMVSAPWESPNGVQPTPENIAKKVLRKLPQLRN